MGWADAPRGAACSKLPFRLCALAIVAVTVAAWALLASPPHRATAAGDCTTDASMDAEEKAFLVLINNYRTQNGLPPLGLSYTLTKASQWKSTDMANNNYFAHDDLSRTWDQRIRDCGYGYNTWLGENIAAGYVTAQDVFNGWKSSPGHNANMLGTNYTAIGIGRFYRAGSPYGWYWSTDFGGVSDGYVSISQPAPLQPVATAPSPRVIAPPRWRSLLQRYWRIAPVSASSVTARPAR